MKNFITFNPGPSELTSQTIELLKEIADSGLLSLSHRGSKFKDVCQKAIAGLHSGMEIPEEFAIFFQPSASAAMDTLLRNLVFKTTYHFVNGSFAERFFETAQQIGLEAKAQQTAWNASVAWETAQIPPETELIALTHNETSTGSMWPHGEISKIRLQYPQSLLAIDVASSFGAMKMNWTDADIWFGSVQKCLGLPSGLGFIIANPKALEKSKDVLKNKGGVASWQRFDVILKQITDFQTFETPNMLAIALLARQMASWNLTEIERDLEIKKNLLYTTPLSWKPYIHDPKWYSSTVANFVVDNPKEWHQKAQEAQFLLGQGYGKLKESCIRIGNFPSLDIAMTERLLKVLSTFKSS